MKSFSFLSNEYDFFDKYILNEFVIYCSLPVLYFYLNSIYPLYYNRKAIVYINPNTIRIFRSYKVFKNGSYKRVV